MKNHKTATLLYVSVFRAIVFLALVFFFAYIANAKTHEELNVNNQTEFLDSN